MTQRNWFLAGSAADLVGQTVTFDFNGVKVTQKIKAKDVEPSRIRKGEIVRVVLSEMPWHLDTSAVTCERGCLNEHRWENWRYGAPGHMVTEAQDAAMIAVGAAVAAPIAAP